MSSEFIAANTSKSPPTARSSTRSASEHPSRTPSLCKGISLSNDILYDIFLGLVQDQYHKQVAGSNDFHGRTLFPWNLSAVCRQWKQVCMDNGNLWAYIVLGLTEDKYDLAMLRLICLQLEKSRNSPLFIDATDFRGWGSEVTIFRAVLEHSSRWKELKFDSTTFVDDEDDGPDPKFSEVFRSLIPPDQNLNSLEKIWCGTDIYNEGYIDLPFQNLRPSALPSLRSATLSFVWDDTWDIPLPWDQLTSLSIDEYTGDKKSVIALLSRCTNLASFNFRYGHHSAFHNDDHASASLPQLTKLTLSDFTDTEHSILEYIQAQNLSSFTYTYGPSIPNQVLQTLTKFLPFASNALKSLSLSYIVSDLQAEHFAEILKALPNIRYLFLGGKTLYKSLSFPSCEPFLATVTRKDEDTSEPLFLPRLEELELRDFEFDSILLTGIVKSRADLQLPSSPMRRLKISFSGQSKDWPSARYHTGAIQQLLGSCARELKLHLCLNLSTSASPSLFAAVSVSFHLNSNSIRTCWQLPHRTFTSVSGSPNDRFNYSSGRWIVNNDLRLEERRREFDVNELCRLAAQSIGQSSQDIATFIKLAEGGFNRNFLITMHDGFEMVARIPYPVTVPKFYAITSEVATMHFLRSFGLPVPKVYGYSPSSDNTAKTEYIFMQFIRGTKLSDVWLELDESDILSVLRQLTQLKSRMMSIPFPAGGSLYYTHDLEKVAETTRIPLNNERFCVGPDARLHMWYGRRSQLNVDRGPYESIDVALAAAALKELEYLKHFGRPLPPFRRERREAYGYKEQSPLDHVKNLERYLLIASSLVPKNPGLHHFRIRHPDLQQSNIIVSRSSDSNQLEIVSLIDWQHASILPLFLLAGIPGRLQNYDDPVSQDLIPPSLPLNVTELDRSEQSHEMGLYRDRLVHFHYVKYTEEYNKLHHDALSDTLSMFIRRLFDQAGAPWEGETHALKATLIEATEMWGSLAGEGVPCPVMFEPEDLRKTKELSTRLQVADENFEGCRGMVGFETETWVSNEHFERAIALAELLKLKVLTAIPENVRAKTAMNWFLDDMDEKDYM